MVGRHVGVTVGLADADADADADAVGDADGVTDGVVDVGVSIGTARSAVVPQPATASADASMTTTGRAMPYLLRIRWQRMLTSRTPTFAPAAVRR